MLAFQQRRADAWRRMLIIAFVLLSLILLWMSSDHIWGTVKDYAPETAADVMGYLSVPHERSLKEIAAYFQDDIHPMNDPHYHTHNGRDRNITAGSHKWEKQGKKLLLLDVDTRLDKSEGALLNPDLLERKTMKPRTAGLLNHFLYSLIHGYDYRIIRAPEATDRHGTWVKVPMIQQALKEYDMVVFLDADAVFQHLDVPYEWLLQLWNVSDSALVAMAEDPNGGPNLDSKGWVLWNTGFVTAIQSERTQRLFNEWWDCTNGKQYPDCKQWAYDWAHEQRALGEHLRYDWDVPNDLAVIPCTDGNGFDDNCGGAFVAHYWNQKHRTIDDLYGKMPEEYVQSLHQGFHKKIDHYFRDWNNYTYPLVNVPSLL